jgi:CBS domain-containing protein
MKKKKQHTCTLNTRIRSGVLRYFDSIISHTYRVRVPCDVLKMILYFLSEKVLHPCITADHRYMSIIILKIFIIQLIPDMFMQNAVKEIMSTKLETIDVTRNAQEAAKKMNDRRISSVLVVDEENKSEEPIGIVTERDLVIRVCAAGTSSKDVGIREIMSSPIVTVEPNATVETAADLMLSNKVRHLLVIDEQTGKPVGIVAPSDLNKYLRGNIDMDEVNARILEAIKAEELTEP